IPLAAPAVRGVSTRVLEADHPVVAIGAGLAGFPTADLPRELVDPDASRPNLARWDVPRQYAALRASTQRYKIDGGMDWLSGAMAASLTGFIRYNAPVVRVERQSTRFRVEMTPLLSRLREQPMDEVWDAASDQAGAVCHCSAEAWTPGAFAGFRPGQ